VIFMDIVDILVSRGIVGIVMDSSFIIRLFEEPGCLEDAKHLLHSFKLAIPYSVYSELGRLASSGKGRLVNYALEYLTNNYSLSIDESYKGNPDEDLVSMALKYQYVVASQDWGVQRLARSKGLNIIYFKDRYLKLL